MAAMKRNFEAVCVECAHHFRKKGSTFDMCSRPKNVVTGVVIQLACVNERSKTGNCGPGGKGWEPREKKQAAE